MQPTRSLVLAFLALTLSVGYSLAQPPDQEGRGRGRGRGGSGPDGKGERIRISGSGSSDGREGRGGGWGSRGGATKAGDPSGYFDRYSGGKDVWKRSESDARGQMAFDRMAERMGITNGEITRKQFMDYINNKAAQRDSTSAVPAGPTPAEANDPNADRYARLAEFSFRSLDKNGDGRLDYNEMPEDLRAELSKWDTNNNGTIELEEYKRYYAAKRQQHTADLSEMRAAYGGSGPVVMPATSRTPPGKAEAQKPLVYTKDNLPKEVPSWFRQLADADAQIAFYEWKAAGRSLDEFRKYDLNNDGFITVAEVLAFQAAQTKQSATGKPSFNVAQGGETIAGNPVRSTPGSTPNVIRIDRTNSAAAPGKPNVIQFDPSRFRNGGFRGRGDRTGGSPQNP